MVRAEALAALPRRDLIGSATAERYPLGQQRNAPSQD